VILETKEPDALASGLSFQLMFSSDYGAAGAFVDGTSTGGADSCFLQPDTTAATATMIAKKYSFIGARRIGIAHPQHKQLG
jgi:hypothetical protein